VKALVADDDRVVSHLVCGLLRAKGWEVTPVFDAMQALMFAMREPRPDVIILDINMPGGTGVQALTKLKASTKTASIPVVVLSGVPDERLFDQMREKGADELLHKPVDPPALFAALERVFPTPAQG
jgi:CheY-like chemotaxis protein